MRSKSRRGFTSLRNGSSPKIMAAIRPLAESLERRMMLTATPVAWYHFDEGTGTTAADASGNGNTATLTGDASWQSQAVGFTTGTAGADLHLDGAGAADLGNPSDLNFAGQITLSAWFKPTSTSGLQDIISHGYSVSPDAEVFLRINNGNYEIGSWNGTGYLASMPIPQSDLNTWVNLTGVYDGNGWVLYRDGQFMSDVPASVGAITVNTDWLIGAGAHTGDNRYFTGDIDEVKIFNQALYGQDILSQMGYQAPTLNATTGTPAVKGQAYTLNLSATYPTGVINTISSWTVDWGDGTSSSPDTQSASGQIAALTHTYDLSGNYLVKVTATDAQGTHSINASQLDPTFGVGGITSIPSTEGAATALTTQLGFGSPAQEFYVAAGSINNDFGIARLTLAGAMDDNFGIGGVATIGLSGYQLYGQSVAVDEQNRLLVAGYAVPIAGGMDEFAIARFNFNGTIDTSFGTGGLVTYGAANDSDMAYSVLTYLSNSGSEKILLGGTDNGLASLLQLNDDGTPDSSFGTGGYIVPGGYMHTIYTLSRLADGQFLAGGFSWGANGTTDYGAVRYNANGSLDTTFGVGGLASADFYTNDFANTMAVGPSGQILLTGHVLESNGSGQYDMAMAAFTPDGQVDDSFGTNGRVQQYWGSVGFEYGGQYQSDGKIVVSGMANSDVALQRFNANGSTDSTFNGNAIDSQYVGGPYSGNQLLIDSTGQAVTLGLATSPLNAWALTRHLADMTLTVLPSADPSVQIAGGDTLIQEGQTLKLTAVAIPAQTVDPNDYIWSVTKDGAAYASGRGTTYPFIADRAGAYQVTLTLLTTSSGSTSNEGLTASTLITVQNAPPQNVTINGPTSASTFHALTFSGSATSQSGTSKTLNYQWSVTDSADNPISLNGAVTNLSSFQFMPTVVGGYKITLTVTDSEGGVGTKTVALNVTAGSALASQWTKLADTWTPVTAWPNQQSTDVVWNVGDTILDIGHGKILVAGRSEANSQQLGTQIFVAQFLVQGNTFEMDPSFNGGSPILTQLKLYTQATGGWMQSEDPTRPGLAIQPDGKILVTGALIPVDDNPPPMPAVLRLNGDGSVDTGFGNSGYATVSATDLDTLGGRFDAVAALPDGTIVAAGLEQGEADNYSAGDMSKGGEFLAARFTSSGALDVSQSDGHGGYTGGFGDTNSSGARTGIWRHRMQSQSIGYELVTSIAVQSDGKIILGGNSSVSGTTEERFTIARLTPDGDLDTSFNVTGYVIADELTNPPAESSVDDLDNIVLQPDGKIVAFGSQYNPNNPWNFAVARYNTDGSPDQTFGNDGVVLEGHEEGLNLSCAMGGIDESGDILVAGGIDGSSATIMRLGSDGTLDTSFGSAGFLSLSYPSDDPSSEQVFSHAIFVEPDGSFYLSGAWSDPIQSTGAYQFAMARYQLPSNAARDLHATGMMDGSVNLAWRDAGSFEDGFVISRSVDDVNFNTVGYVGSNVTTYHDTTVDADTHYYYRVKAFWVADNGSGPVYTEQSDYATADLTTGEPNDTWQWVETVAIPDKPTDNQSSAGYNPDPQDPNSTAVLSTNTYDANQPLMLVASGYISITDAGDKTSDAQWGYNNSVPYAISNAGWWGGNLQFGIGVDDTSRGLTRYPYWGDPATDSAHTYSALFSPTTNEQITFDYHDNYYPDNHQTQTWTAGGTTYTDSAIIPLQVAIYRQVAAPPIGLTAVGTRTDATHQNVTLSWDNASSDGQLIEIERADGDGAFAPLASVPAGTSTYTDTSVQLNTSYAYRVKTLSTYGTSGYSNDAAVVITNSPPVFDPTSHQVTDLDYNVNFQVHATDPDPGDSVSYSFTNGSTSWAGLTIDNTGKVTGKVWAPAADFPWTPVVIPVRATDQSGAYTDQNVYVIEPFGGTTTLPSITTPASATLSSDQKSAALSVGASENGSNHSLIYSWYLVTAPPANSPAPEFSVNGVPGASTTTVTFGAAGNYTFRVFVTDSISHATVTSDVSVTVGQTLGSLEVSPPEMQLMQGGSWNFSVTGADQFGNPMDAGTVTWSSNAPGGDYTAGSSGAFDTITASSGAVTGKAFVGVLGGSIDHAPVFAVDPTAAKAPAVPINGTRYAQVNLNVLGADDDRESNLIYTWSVTSGTGTVTFGTGTGGKTINGTNAGKRLTAYILPGGATPYTYSFTVTIKDSHGNSKSETTVPITVDDPSVIPNAASVSIWPQGWSIGAGAGTLNLTATVRDQYGYPVVPQPTSGFNWTVVGGLGSVVQDPSDPTGAIFTPPSSLDVASETTTVQVTYPGGLSATTTINIIRDSKPTALLTAPTDSGPWMIDSSTDIDGVVLDPLSDVISPSWKLIATPLSGGTPIQVGEGAGEVGSAPDTGAYLTTLDPSLLPNGAYTLTLSVKNFEGETQTDSHVIEIINPTKAGNLTLPVTDMTISTGGLPITISRMYDSTLAGRDEGLGNGWRLELPNVNLTTTAFERNHISDHPNHPAFVDGDLITITLPGGDEQAFTFTPTTADGINFKAAFTPVSGSSTLTAWTGSAPVLSRAATGEYYTASGGFNPAASGFGNTYYLTTANGTVYTINASSAMVQYVKDAKGNELDYTQFNASPTGYITSIPITGTEIQIALSRDVSGRVTAVWDTRVPSAKITYIYNNVSDELLGVIDRVNNTTAYVYSGEMLLSLDGPATRYAVITNSSGQPWNVQDNRFEALSTNNWSQYAIGLTAVNDSTGTPRFYWAELPSNLPASSGDLTATYYEQAGSAPASSDPIKGSDEQSGNQPPAHFLTEAYDGRGARVLSATYDPSTTQLQTLTDANDNNVSTADSLTGSTESGQSATDLLGNTTETVTDNFGNPTRQIQDIKDELGNITGYQVTEIDYTYDVNGQIISGTQYVPFIIPSPDPTSRRYTQHGSVVAQLTQYYTTETVLPQYQNDLFLPQTVTVYGTNNTARVTTYSGYVDGHPQNTNVELDQLSPSGNVLNRIKISSSATLYNSHGSPTQTTDAMGNTTYYDYDPTSNRLTDTYRKDSAGNQILLSTNNYYSSGPSMGLLQSTSTYTNASLSKTIYYTYTADGKVARTYYKGPDGNWVVNTNVYDADGRQIATRQGVYTDGGTAGVLDVSSTQLDADGYPLITESLLPIYNGTLLTLSQTGYSATGQTDWTADEYDTTANPHRTHYTYDAHGNVIQVLNPDGTEQRTVYDSMNRVIWQTDAYASGTSFVIDDQSTGTGHFIDNNTTTTNATHTIYDSQGRVIATQQYTGVLITVGTQVAKGGGVALPIATLAAQGTLISSTATYYDDAGRVVEVDSASGQRTGTIYYPDGQVQYSGVLLPSAPIGGPFAVTNFDSSIAYAEMKYDLVTDTMPSDSVSYDADIQHMFENGAWSTLETDTYYDGAGNVIETQYPDKSFTQTLYGLDDQTIDSTTLTSVGITDPPAIDLSGGGHEVVKIDQRKQGDPAVATFYVYDRAGNLTDVWQPAVTVPYPSVIEGDNPLGYWRLGESSGTTASDSSGANHNGTYNGSISPGQAGALAGDSDTSTSFNGGQIDGSGLLANTAGDTYTIEAWINPSTSATGGTIFAKGQVGTSYGYGLCLADNRVLVMNTYADYATGATITRGQWNYVVAVFTPTGTTIYVNGQQAGSTTATSTADSFGTWTIGARPGTTGLDPFLGSIDELAVYHSALSAAQIAAHYGAGQGTVLRPHWRYAYDSQGNMTSETDPNGNTTTFTYDQQGQQHTETLPSVNVSYTGVVDKSTPQIYWRLDDSTTTATDSSGNGNTGTYSGTYIPNSAGALTADGDNDAATNFTGGGVASTGTFNDGTVTVAAWVNLKSLPAGGYALIAGFDQGGGVTDKTLYVDSSGHIYWYVYDGAQKTITGPALALNQWIYVVGTCDGTTSRLYVNGSLVGSIAAANSYTGYTSPNFHVGWSPNFYALDAAIDEVAVYDHALSAAQIAGQYNVAIGNNASTQTTTYDQYGRILGRTDYDGNVATYSYANTGTSIAKVSQVTYTPSGSTTANETVTYYYDAYGRKQKVVDTADGTTTYNYDESGGTVTIDPTTGAMTAVSGSFGNLTSVVSSQGTAHYVYDAVTGHLVETWTGTGSDDTTSTTETLYGYDDQGRLASVTTARENGAPVGLTSSVGTREDAEGGVINTSLPTTLYLYDGNGNLIRQVNPNNTETDYDYTNYWNASGGEEIVTNKRTSDGTILSKFTYTFNAQRQKISELDQMTDAGEGASNSQLYTWAYDADGRLTDETFDNQNDDPSTGGDAVTTDDYHNHYDYDLNGNRVDEKIDASDDGGTGSTAVYDEVTNYEYNGDNQLKTETQTTVATGTTVYQTVYAYDNNGSLTQSARTGKAQGVTIYTYDARNRILTVTSGDSTTTYSYNDDGMLVQQTTTISGATNYLTFLIDTNNPTGYSQVLETRANGSLVATYTLGKAIIAQNTTGTISFIMLDGHGSTRQLTSYTNDSSNGHVMARYDYDAFGNLVALAAETHASNTANTSVLYVGMLLDAVTGNYRSESREYAAPDGRFFWRDSYLPGGGDTENSNLYVYAGNNAINASDPSGHDELSDESFALAGEYQAEEAAGLADVQNYVKSRFGDIGAATELGWLGAFPISFEGIDWSRFAVPPPTVTVGAGANVNLETIPALEEIPLNVSLGAEYGYNFKKQEHSVNVQLGGTFGLGVGGGANVGFGLGWGEESKGFGWDIDLEFKFNELPIYVQEEVTNYIWQYVPLAVGGPLGTTYSILSTAPIQPYLAGFLHSLNLTAEISMPLHGGGIHLGLSVAHEWKEGVSGGASIARTYTWLW